VAGVDATAGAAAWVAGRWWAQLAKVRVAAVKHGKTARMVHEGGHFIVCRRCSFIPNLSGSLEVLFGEEILPPRLEIALLEIGRIVNLLTNIVVARPRFDAVLPLARKSDDFGAVSLCATLGQQGAERNGRKSSEK
jgi:hypothetical protein